MEDRRNIEKSDLGKNVRYLCSRYRSISEVCRQLDINRQQFNRYLSGQQTPSLYTLARISEFFEVGLDEIQLPHDAFRARISSQAASADDAKIPKALLERAKHMLLKPMPQIGDYEGYYHRYYYSFAYRGLVIRTLLRIWKDGSVYLSRHVERISRFDAPVSLPATFKYDGVVLYLSGRLFLLECETLLDSTISQAILTPVTRPGTRLLSGVQCAITTGTGNEPTCTRVVLEYLGKNVELRGAMKKCGLYDPASGAIDDTILKLIKNDNRADAFTFRSRQI